MTQADPSLFEFLKSREREASVEDSAIKSQWGDRAVEAKGSSALLALTDAEVEAQRQQDLTGQALAEDQVVVAGLFLGLEGQTIRVTDDRLGYDQGRDMLVTWSTADFNQNRTTFGGYVAL